MTDDRPLLGRGPRRRRRHPAVAAVPGGRAQVPARPHRQRAHAAPGDLRPAGAARRGPRSGRHRPRPTATRCVAQLPGPSARRAVLAEPSARDSMAAIGLAAALLERARPRRRDGLVRRRPRDRRPRRLRASAVRDAPSTSPATAGWSPSASSRPSRPRRSATSTLGDAARRPRRRRAVRGVRGEAVGRGGRGATSPPGATAGTPACSSSGPRVLLDLLAAGTRSSPPPCATIAADPDRLDELLAGAAQDRARPRRRRARGRRRAGRDRAGVVRLGRRRRLRLAGHAARADDGGRCRAHGARRRRAWCRPSTPPAWSCPRAGARSRWSAWTTSSSSTPPTPLLVTTRARAPGGQGRRRRAQGVRPRRPDLSAVGRAATLAATGSRRVGLGGVGVGVLEHERVRAAPLSAEQYWHTPDLLAWCRSRRCRRPTSG